jgi:hypothetical protein
MWVYIESSIGWELGFFSPNSKFISVETYDSIEKVQEKVHYLNGGNSKALEEIREAIYALLVVNQHK